MMILSVDDLDNVPDGEEQSVINEILKMKVPNFKSKFKISLSSQEIYNKIFKITNIPKCKYCGNVCTFKSLSKGYKDHCDSNTCKKKYFLEQNNKGKQNNRKLYDCFVLNHIEFYTNITFPFVDIYDNKIVESERQFNSKSFKGLHIFDETHICLFCKQKYTFNKFLNNKLVCNSHSCRNKKYQKFIQEYKQCSEIPFKLYVLNKKYNTLTNDELFNIVTKFGFEKAKHVILNTAIIYKSYYIVKTNNKYSFVKNNIIENDMLATCKSCGKQYVKYDKIVKNDEIIKVQIGAMYSCGTMKCYRNCLRLYEYTEATRKKQSNTLKNKILFEGYTPKSVNSRTHNREFTCDNIKFRSSWEYLFYIIMKIKGYAMMYEHVRVPYFDTKHEKRRIYIIDFCCHRDLYEVKPNSKIDENNDKLSSAMEFANANNYNFKIIDEGWLKNNFTYEVFKYIKQNEIDRCKKLWRQFYEN